MKTLNTFDVEYLEQQVDALAAAVHIKPETWEKFMNIIAELKSHNQFMYAHSLRVGIYAHGIAAAEGQKVLKFPLFAGCGHDIGKCDIANTLLNSKDLQPHEFEQIKRHTTEGFERLKDSFLFTGLIAGLHHKYKDGGYGIDLEADAPIPLGPNVRKAVEDMSKLVMIADFFDALTTRDDNKGYIDDPSNPDQQREVMLRFFPGDESRIDWLISHRI